ncbi:MAG: M48 family metalloprotease [bacterium]|nr:M48 family metalloprotease [bacterium]
MTLRETMPAWVGWLGPAVLFGMVLLWLVLVPGLVFYTVRRRLAAASHWTEKAALATEGRAALIFGFVMWPIVTVALARVVIGPFSRIPPTLAIVAAVTASVFGSLWAGWRFVGRDLEQPLPGFVAYVWLVARKWWPLVALFAIGVFAPGRLTSLRMIPWTVLAVGGLYSLRYMAELYAATGVAVPASPQLAAAIERAAARSDSEVPKAFVVDSHAANAAALPARNLIITTQRLVDELGEAEQEAVMLHEIAHLNERRSVTRLRALSVLLYLPFLAVKPLIGSGILYLAAAVLLVMMMRKRITVMSAAEEGRADHEAAELAHESHVFGEALLKMHQAALIPAFLKRDPHGPLHERLVHAGVTPDFEPITSGPRMRPLLAGLALGMVLLFSVVVVPLFAMDFWDGDRGSHIAIAFGWRTDQVLGYNGYLAADEGDFETATLYLEEAVARGDEHSLANLAWALGAVGRCREAREVHFDMLNRGADRDEAAAAGRWVAYCYEQN